MSCLPSEAIFEFKIVVNFVGWSLRLPTCAHIQNRHLFHYQIVSLQFKSCKNKHCFNVRNNKPIMLQFCTCHDSWAVMTCAKLWHDWLIQIWFTARRIFTKFHLWAHNPLVKRVQGQHIKRLISTWHATRGPVLHHLCMHSVDKNNFCKHVGD